MNVRGRFRILYQRATGQVRNQVDSQLERLNEVPGAGPTLKFARAAGGGVLRGATKARRSATTKAAQAMGYDSYREELEKTLDAALRVIAAQEERIRRLERRK